ncbi:MAG: rRNA maturation RNase YbeY [Armatimonadetes bacterium]|nr:rRNA maturation RNase YbeY [Armatimonadota bacterium]
MGLATDPDNVPAGVDLEQLRRVHDSAIATLLGAEVETSLVLCDDTAIAELNEAYLQHQGPTDVISFPQLELTPGVPALLPPGTLLGDVVISVDTAARQAEPYPDWELNDELALLLVHGLLHLCGYDDQTAVERARMQTREDDLLRACGLGPVPRDER